MQSWAKRGLQTALVTGGLLMLGTGIASADETVSPDAAPSPIDLNVNIPLEMKANGVGTPIGQLDLPEFEGTVSSEPASEAVRQVARDVDSLGNAWPEGSGEASGAPARQSIEGGFTDSGGFVNNGGTLKGNVVNADVVPAIQICGNAIGVIGNATETADCAQTWNHDQDITTDGANNALAGNALVLDWAAPIAVNGLGGGLAGGRGAASGSATQDITETGDIETNGDGSSISGNVVPAQFATPVQVSGNAASWILGNGYSEFSDDSAATAGGYVKTSGGDAEGPGGAGSGNVVGAPIALPVKFNCNAGAAWGSLANTGACDTSADAKAGDTTEGISGTPTYVQTSGDDSLLDGNIIVPQTGDVANVAGVAASWIGNAGTGQETPGTSSSTVDAGGFVSTTAENSGASGNIVDPALALPVEVFGVGGTYIGIANAAHDNTVDANAGNGSYTNGNGAVISGNTANTQIAGAPEIFGVGGSHIGNATGVATEEKTVTAGGYDGTQGNNSGASGNLVQVPVAVPAELLGVGGSFIGQGTGSADEVKVVQGGGGGSTHDDDGVISSNLGVVPVSLPVQVVGVGGAFIGKGVSKGSTDTTSKAGDKESATGTAGVIAGNLINGPISFPTQVHGDGVVLGGIGKGASENITDSMAGGDVSTDGQNGAGAGNIVQLPIGGTGSIFGNGIAGAGIGTGSGTSDVKSVAGGTADTNGDNGAISGNIISAQALPIVQAFGDAVAAAAIAKGTATNTVDAQSGGDVTTSGVDGGISGNVVDIPLAAVAQAFADAVAVGGNATAEADNMTTGKTGGESTTDGDGSSLSGFNIQQPLGALVQVFCVDLGLFGNASATGTNATEITEEPQIFVPIDWCGSEMAADELPALPDASGLPALALPELPAVPAQAAREDVPALPVQLPALGNLGNTVSVPSMKLPTLKLNTVDQAMTALQSAAVTMPNASTVPAVPAMAALDSNPIAAFFSKIASGFSSFKK
ncbi:beta strand repeat-containing protein [Amycolatopsis sp. NPDC059657]|uniref:beta strand repeat-containing protein n=1 Tax=Amycolatopsis sp. NPDC059657 TaxID=3346899 RepID=UPI00366EEB0D